MCGGRWERGLLGGGKPYAEGPSAIQRPDTKRRRREGWLGGRKRNACRFRRNLRGKRAAELPLFFAFATPSPCLSRVWNGPPRPASAWVCCGQNSSSSPWWRVGVESLSANESTAERRPPPLLLLRPPRLPPPQRVCVRARACFLPSFLEPLLTPP